MPTQYIILLQNIREVIKADKACKTANLKTSIIPVPSHLSSECGMALLSDECELETLKNTLCELNLNPQIYERP